MGQRHQVFIIARVVPHGEKQPRYRCIGAIHHQWCYGRLPLKAAARFMTLIKQTDNAEVIREEISSLHGVYGKFRTKPNISDVPCPFTQYLLSSAWSADLVDPNNIYASTTDDEPAGMGSTEGDNNDGITVVDVTDPEHPSYCFVSIDHLEGKNDNVPTMTPLSATQYVRVYYPEPEDSVSDDQTIRGPQDIISPADGAKEVEESVQSAIQPFNTIPVITMDKLAEAWPSEYEVQNNVDVVPIKVVSDTMVPSLVDLTLRPAVEQAIFTGDVGALELLILLRDKVAIMREVIRSQMPIPDGGVFLLKRIIQVEKSKTIDLSGFHLSGEQIVALLTPEQENGESLEADIEVLNLSHNSQVNIDLVLRVLELSTLPTLRRLVLWNTAVLDADIIGLLGMRPKLFYRLEGLIHPAFIKHQSAVIFPPAFTHITYQDKDLAMASIPYFTPGQIAQGLLDYLAPLNGENEYQARTYTRCRTLAMAAYASEVRPPSTSWSERIIPFLPSAALTLQNEGQWIFAFSPSVRYIPGMTRLYAFARANMEAMKALADEQKRIQPDTESSKEEMKALQEKYQSRLYNIYDVHAFFRELEMDGRPAPNTETLAQLFDLFSVLGGREDPNAWDLMTHDQLVEFMAEVHESGRRWQY